MFSKSPRQDMDAKNVILVVAFLVEENVLDQLVETITDMVATKFLNRTKNTVDHILSSHEFMLASNTAQAKTTLTLKSISTQLEAVTNSLTEVMAPIQHDPPMGGKSGHAPPVKSSAKYVTPAKTAKECQESAPQDCSTEGNFNLCKKINAHLAEINKAMGNMGMVDVADIKATATWI
ncbi:hypothetical protein H2248_001733 [Termitomyces sp. 'cryptogamus']|nr:hypothetical protein H2248_001733 [Termitomyces sp. 'cryptogamus']